MAATVRVGGPLRNLLGGRREVVTDGGTIGEIFDLLDVRGKLCGEDGVLRRYVSVHLNGGADVRHEDGLDTPVADGDVITILSAIGGGSSFRRSH